MQNSAYAPNSSITTKIMRRVTPMRRRRLLSFNIDRPVVSFTFDDCPQSAITHGLRPLESEGWRGSVYIAARLFGITNHHGLHMTGEDTKAVFENGHEIGDHGYSHIDGNQTPLRQFKNDIEINQTILADLGLPPCKTFAYPFGEVTPQLKHSLKTRFTGMRGIQPKPMVGYVDLNQIASTPVYAGTDFDTAIKQIKALKETPAWLTLFTHDIQDTPSNWGCTPAQMIAIIKAVKEIGAIVLPVCEAIDYLKARTI